MPSATLVWFRLDLRLADNPALHAAVLRRGPVIPVFVWSPEEEGDWPPGAASRWWLHHSLPRLDESLRRRGSRLVFRRGPALATLRDLVKQTRADAVVWGRRYEPAVLARDARIQKALEREGVAVGSFPSTLLFAPETIRNRAGNPFQVFTPFWRACLAQPPTSKTVPAPRELPAPPHWPASEPLRAFNLLPTVPWGTGIRSAWEPGEAAAERLLRRFVRSALTCYPSARDIPALAGTSRLSPHLHFGEISPRRVWQAVEKVARSSRSPEAQTAARAFLRQLGWREFAQHLLFHFPHTPQQPLRPEFTRLQWARTPAKLRAWQRGQTGYPLVDAGMRELWTTGWMHNRVRMVVASFLVKDLLLPWQEGARWFWDTLVDADLANNTLGWQWSAGCGADAAPFFRIFNPVMQSWKFDSAGDYIRRWVPELSRLSDKWIHRPWEAPTAARREAGIMLGKTYPRPIVDHAQSRRRALPAFREIRG